MPKIQENKNRVMIDVAPTPENPLKNTQKKKLGKVFSTLQSDLFLELLLKISVKSHVTVARFYAKGSWHQISGTTFVSHLGESSEHWKKLQEKGEISQSRNNPSLLFFAENSYHSYVALFGALLANFNVICAPHHATVQELEWCIQRFSCVAIALGHNHDYRFYNHLGLPIFSVTSLDWGPRSKCGEPQILKQYRKWKCHLGAADGNILSFEEDKIVSANSEMEHENATESSDLNCGRLGFLSVDQKGALVPQTLSLNALLIVCQNFLVHCDVPSHIPFRSLEMLTPTHPFCFLSFLCALMKNGIVGFPHRQLDYEENLRTLKPTYIFATPKELAVVSDFVQKSYDSSVLKSPMKVLNRVQQLQDAMFTNRAMKLPENLFDTCREVLRKTSRYFLGKSQIKNAVEDLRFVVHGLANTDENAVRILELFGIPVIETYGTTLGGGLLSSNTFAAPHLHTLGTPLPHVTFRLGKNSILEYRISHPHFEDRGVWLETGDVVQMTPHGFILTGCKKHLIITTGGVVVSPPRIEKMLKECDEIQDVCLLGDRKPYLTAFVVLKEEMYLKYQENKEEVRNKIQNFVSQMNEVLPRNATLKKFVILEQPFLDNCGEFLANGDLNRKKIIENRAEQVHELYHY